MRVEFYKEQARCLEREPLIAGTKGKTVDVEFEEGWKGRSVMLVFKAGFLKKDVPLGGSGHQTVVIPWEVMAKPVSSLQIGAEGTAPDGTVLRTGWCDMGPVRSGAEPGGGESSEPTPEPWQKVLALIGDMDALDTTKKGSLVEAINEVNRTGGGEGGGEPGKDGVGITSIEITEV